MPKIKPHMRPKSLIADAAKVQEAQSAEHKALEIFFGEIDYSYQGFDEWDAERLTTKLVCRLEKICKYTVKQAIAEKILACYGAWPGHSKIPCKDSYTPAGTDRNWASLQIQGKERLGGYLVANEFHVVVLDKHHHFWPTEKKNT